MGDFSKTVQTNMVFQAVLFIILGLVLLFFPGITLIAIVYCIAAIFAISGIIALVAYFRGNAHKYKVPGACATGVFCIILALVMFLFPVAIAGFFSVVLGAILILCGSVNTVRSLTIKALAGSMWIFGCILGVLTIIGGVIIIWNPFDTSALFIMILGVFFLLNGVSDLIVELAVRNGNQ